MTNKTYICDLKDNVGKEVSLFGWLYNSRSSGKVQFLIVRDGTGLCQCIVEKGQVSKMQFANMSENDEHAEFNGTIPCRMSGQHGFALRLLPQHADLAEQFEPGMIMWESPK